MAQICPSVTATDPHEYRQQLERVSGFAPRIHLDFMDGEFAKTVSPPLESAYWPDNTLADLHVMYERPQEHIAKILNLKPNLVIVHAEADGHFFGIAETLHKAGIKVGVAILPKTNVDVIKPSLDHIDHVLIFSGNLGHFGGEADLSLLEKVKQVRSLNSSIEIGWDGGVNDQTIGPLIDGGVDVLNVGGFIQTADDPASAYARLEALAGSKR